MKIDIQLVTAAVLSVGGLVLLFCGVYIAPQGEIHESLLVGFANHSITSFLPGVG